MTRTPPAPRNPGPSWGYRFLRVTDRILPEWLFRPLRAAGTMIALCGMHAQRRHSREYLRVVLRREPTWTEVFRHFFTFEEVLMQRLRLANGRDFPCEYAPGADAFRKWLKEQHPIILGTMHVGLSDMLGFQLANHLRNPVYLVRLRVGNSHDTEALATRFRGAIRFIWVNEPAELLYALKDALQTPSAVAIQCDRVEHGSRVEMFEFLGARRAFPFTIYHLALIFQRPVILSYGTPLGPDRSQLHCSDAFEPVRGEPKEQALRRARLHFQTFLTQLEATLRGNPYLWFNFTPLNEAVGERAAT